jgi:hypothetical protein
MRFMGVLIAMVAPLLLAGCTTVSPPTSVTPATTPTGMTAATAPQSMTPNEPRERLQQAVKAVGDIRKMCNKLLDQHQITTAISYVRCWGEPSRSAYQHSDLLIMDLVEKRLDVLYKAAAMFDNDQLTEEQFLSVDEKLRDWFFEEINKRFAGQLSAPAPAPSSPAPTTRYK